MMTSVCITLEYRTVRHSDARVDPTSIIAILLWKHGNGQPDDSMRHNWHHMAFRKRGKNTYPYIRNSPVA